ncbi:MAG: hypothetical protein Q7R57_06665 [Dehalococcoidales bacterium]|nr:hypothetical protein [Dehalococcoidales bacterium]
MRDEVQNLNNSSSLADDCSQLRTSNTSTASADRYSTTSDSHGNPAIATNYHGDSNTVALTICHGDGYPTSRDDNRHPNS